VPEPNFDERIAKRYEDFWPDLFEPLVVDPANLTTQDEQVACFGNVAAHLEPGGCFVIEVYVPELQRLPPGETIHAFAATPTHLGFEEYDIASQIAFSHHYWLIDGELETFSSPHATRGRPSWTSWRDSPA
jgi:hypothetical protein